jgi:photoactive yellow protein
MRCAEASAMPPMPSPCWDDPGLFFQLEKLEDGELDELTFGVIGFGSDADQRVLRYSAYEARRSGLDPASVLGLPLFGVVAQCMNNYLVAQQFEDAETHQQSLDVTLDFVLTLRMRPTPVKLRLLSEPGYTTHYVAISWPA